jgi:nonsense-mediated mRNA decay protein 3
MAAATFTPAATPGDILCCLCGVNIQPNPTNMCVGCLRNQVDITEGIQKQVTITYCKDCGRYLQPPRHWMAAELESKELLTFCIKRIKGLQKVKLVDAGFVWTEPHSKRLKVKLTVQSEVMNGAILQQTFVVDFQVEWNMCLDCNRANTKVNAWKAVVQVRSSPMPADHKSSADFRTTNATSARPQLACVAILRQ